MQSDSICWKKSPSQGNGGEEEWQRGRREEDEKEEEKDAAFPTIILSHNVFVFIKWT